MKEGPSEGSGVGLSVEVVVDAGSGVGLSVAVKEGPGEGSGVGLSVAIVEGQGDGQPRMVSNSRNIHCPAIYPKHLPCFW